MNDRLREVLSSDDCKLIDRVRQRFVDSCSARWEMSESTRDAMELVDVVERLSDQLLALRIRLADESILNKKAE